MAERILSTPSSFASEVEYAKKHINSLASVAGQAEYGSAFSLNDDERASRVSRAEIPLVDPPATTSSSAGSSSNSTITLTIKSSKPVLSLSLDCSVTASISDLKHQLHTAFKDQGAPEPASQRWIFKGKAMADERLLKEYDGIKDGDTVNLMVKAGSSTASASASTAAQAVPAAAAAAAAATPAVNTSTTTPSASAIPPSSPAAAVTTKSRSDSLSAPFAFTPGSMGPPRSRTTSTSSLSASNGSNGAGGRGHHARVPSITLTTDFSNFNNLSGNNAAGGSPSPDGYTSPNRSHSRSPSLSTSTSANNVDPFSANVGAAPGSPTIIRSGDSTPLSTPGTPMSGIVGYGRTKSPSISVPIDLDNIDMMMNPLYSSDRTHPVGLSPNFIKTIKDPNVWNDLLGFLDGKFKEHKEDSKDMDVDQQGEHSNDSKRVFEMWLNASKEWMTASDIARIRDSTGVWGLAGH